ncbi:ectoine hydroxylase [Litchfieldella qijiaojingensis]|uniref:Ectoine hydroxylase n=1 Tax=Litchfieldella qijiaojingensis TaxID=980347 RepID=A0ABQ2Z1A9_9GAMM|nr:ectoine hydroxylase [Halomonas qijiaojingensis]GGX99232.1 ectoine hydroxylase [Halomonas qijiaojingensis]
MSVQTASRNPSHHAAPSRDPYPTRLARPWDLPWIDRQEAVVKGKASDGPLTQQQLDTFERNGFLFEPGFLSAEEVAELREELKILLDSDEYAGKDFSITEPDSQEIRSLFAVHFLSERFARLAKDERLMGRARQIVGGDVYVHQSRINYKPGFEGKGFNWHSDFETWHAEDGMPAMHAVSASIVLTDNHHYNGPLMLIPGSHRVFVACLGETPDDHHKQSLKTQEFGVPSREALRELIGRNGIEAPTGAAGGLLLFDCNTLHGSNANMSPDPRSNVFFVYNRVDNACGEPYAAKRRRPAFLAHEPGEFWTP